MLFENERFSLDFYAFYAFYALTLTIFPITIKFFRPVEKNKQSTYFIINYFLLS